MFSRALIPRRGRAVASARSGGGRRGGRRVFRFVRRDQFCSFPGSFGNFNLFRGSVSGKRSVGAACLDRLPGLRARTSRIHVGMGGLGTTGSRVGLVGGVGLRRLRLGVGNIFGGFVLCSVLSSQNGPPGEGAVRSRGCSRTCAAHGAGAGAVTGLVLCDRRWDVRSAMNRVRSISNLP